ncbi:MAG: hypothetical protein AAGC55_02170 [Myxococcota bacterium]
MGARLGASATVALLAMVAHGCQGGDKPFAEAVIIESLDQAIGGPTANARIGDYLLHNDQIRAVVEQGAVSFHPTDVGGSLIDLDLVRPEREFRAGSGLDQLGQLAPIANLSLAQADREANVRITRSAAGAEVTTATGAEPAYRILLALTLLLNQRLTDSSADYRIYNEYELRPGERMLRVTSTLGFDVPFCRIEDSDGCSADCDDAVYDDDCEDTCRPARCQLEGGGWPAVAPADPMPDRDPASILDIALGDLPRPLGTGECSDGSECADGETCVDVTSSTGGVFRVCRRPDQRDAGVFLGDLLIFGGNVTPFLRGIGYDTETDIRRLFDQGGDTLANPLQVDGVFATGDRVSYGYASPDGDILVPIFQGPFSLGATHAASCPTAEPGCLSGTVVRFERWISVGDGDVASAQEPILRALAERANGGAADNDNTAPAGAGIIRGAVTRRPSGQPLSGIHVYALRDPRDLPCTGECAERCPAITGDPAEFDLDQLIAANRCRTVDPPQYPLGTAAIETFAATDPGTDPIRNGRFEMTVPAGRYLLIAVDDHRARSALVALEVGAGSRLEAALSLPEPGSFEYVIYDESGRPGPGRVTVGQCLPTGPCASDDDCAAGELCQSGSCACPWTALLPIELGGHRPQDGVVASDHTASGHGRVELPPGTYELVFSRGPHYTIDRHTVTIEPRVATRVEAYVNRAVDRQGWVTADFHIHSTNSMDSGTPLDNRVIGAVAEDMDFLSSSDHDWLTRYQYLIDEMGLSDRLGNQVGVEITTQEYGHFIAFPLRYQAWDDGERETSNGAVQWRGRSPLCIMESARRQLATDDIPVIIDIPHPFDYFDFYQLDPVDMRPTPSLLATINPMLDPSNFSGDFDAMELANTKNFSRIRRATIGEVRAYGQALDQLIADLEAGLLDLDSYGRKVYELSVESIRQRLHRTVEEQEAIVAGRGAEVPCFCGSDGDCAAGLVCDQAILTCVDQATGEPPVSSEGLCARFRGVIDDWFNMLNRGVIRTGLSGSDLHDEENGYMRTFLRVGSITPPYLQSKHVAEAIRAGRAIVSNGPMIHFTVAGAQVGDTAVAEPGDELTLSLRVEKAPWYDVDRIEVYRNGVLIHWLRGCESTRGREDPDGHGCIQTGDTVVSWQGELRDSPDRDAWYVVLVHGLDGRTLAPVYNSQVLASLGTPEITQRIYDIIPILREFRNPRFPSQHPLFPFAFTNPIYVDLGGNGWTPPLPPPCWCVPGRDIGCTGQNACVGIDAELLCPGAGGDDE